MKRISLPSLNAIALPKLGEVVGCMVGIPAANSAATHPLPSVQQDKANALGVQGIRQMIQHAQHDPLRMARVEQLSTPIYCARLKVARLYKHDAQASESVRPEPTRLRVVLVFVSFWTACGIHRECNKQLITLACNVLPLIAHAESWCNCRSRVASTHLKLGKPHMPPPSSRLQATWATLRVSRLLRKMLAKDPLRRPAVPELIEWLVDLEVETSSERLSA